MILLGEYKYIYRLKKKVLYFLKIYIKRYILNIERVYCGRRMGIEKWGEKYFKMRKRLYKEWWY